MKTVIHYGPNRDPYYARVPDDYDTAITSTINDPYSQRTRDLVARVLMASPRGHQRRKLAYQIGFVSWPIKLRENGRYK